MYWVNLRENSLWGSEKQIETYFSIFLASLSHSKKSRGLSPRYIWNQDGWWALGPMTLLKNREAYVKSLKSFLCVHEILLSSSPFIQRFQQVSGAFPGLLQAQWRSAGKFSTFFSHECLFNEKNLCLSQRSYAELLFSPPAIRMLKGPTSFRL